MFRSYWEQFFKRNDEISLNLIVPAVAVTMTPYLIMFHFQFMDPLSSFSVGYKGESNDANDSKKEDLSQLFGI